MLDTNWKGFLIKILGKNKYLNADKTTFQKQRDEVSRHDQKKKNHDFYRTDIHLWFGH